MTPTRPIPEWILILLLTPALLSGQAPPPMRVLEVTGLTAAAPAPVPPIEDNGTGTLRVELPPGTRLVAAADGVLSVQHPGIYRFRTRGANGQEVVYVLLNGTPVSRDVPLSDPHLDPDAPMAYGEIRRLGIVRAGQPLLQASDAGFMTIGVGLPELASVPRMASWTRLERSSEGSSLVLAQARDAPRYIPRPDELPRGAIRPPPEVIGATLQKLAPLLGAEVRVRTTISVSRGKR